MEQLVQRSVFMDIFLQKIIKGKVNRILAVATGALHSPLTVQQKGTIPCIAHAVSIESGSGLS